MNKSYKSVWNESTGSWVAVSELATGRSKSKRAKTAISKAILTQIAVGGMGLAGASIAMAGDPVKLGTGSTVNVADGVAIGTDATVDADVGANASKTGGVAIGDQSYVAGSGVAIGQNASAGSDSLAMGTGATASLGSTAIGQNATSFNKMAVALGQNATAGGENSLALGANSTAEYRDSVAIGQGATSDRTNSVSFGNGTLNRQLTNVADGTQDSDAVTLKQLKNIGVTTNTDGTVTNSFVAYDANSSKGTVTLQGASGTKITNLAAGAVTAASKDAINGSQLLAVAQSAADAFGGASTVGADGKISKPTYTIDGKAYTSLDSALTAAAATGTGTGGGGVDADALHYDTPGHTSVTLGGTAATGAVKLTNVATGTSATDAVNVAQLNSATNGLNGATATLKYIGISATSTGTQAQASGKDAMAVGGSSFASGDGALAFGTNARAMGVNAVAVGTGSTASKDNTFSIGALGSERRLVNVAVGTGKTDGVNLGQVQTMIQNATTVQGSNVVKSTQKLGAVALGDPPASSLAPEYLIASGPTDKVQSIQASGNDSIAIGLNTHATGDVSVAIGSNVNSVGNNSVAVGSLAIANGTGSQAFGVGANSVSAGGLAMGNNATVNTDSENATAIGTNSTAVGINAVAFGSEATSIGTGAMVLGNNSSAVGAGIVVLGNASDIENATGNSVVLGNNNTATGANSVIVGSGVTKATGSNNVVLGNGSDGSQSNVVSIGGKGSERKIVNVAAGTTTTDAVNLGQLNTAIASIPTGGGGDSVLYNSTTHDKVTFGGTAATKAVTLSNVAAGQADTDAVNVKQLTDAGLVVNSTGGATNAFVAYDNNTSKDTITLKGTAGTTKITKLTNGTLSAASSDAVNGSQLFNAASSTAAIIGGGAALDPATGTISKPAVTVGGTTYDNLAGAITAAGTAATDAGTAATAATAAVADAVKYDTTAHAKVTFGGTGAPVTLSNVAAGKADTDAVNVKQLTAMGGMVDSSGNPTNVFVAYDTTAKDVITLKGATSTKITKLTNGTLSAASSDAVNGSQLFNAASSAAAIIGGGAALDPATGTISKPAVTVGGTTFDNLAGAITAAGTAATDAGTAATAATAAVADAVKYDTTAHAKVTFGGTGAPVTLSNVAAGKADTDAVNVKQLTDAGITFNSTGAPTNSFVAYDTSAKDVITLKGATSTKITKLTNGTLSAASSDAVNGSQLFNTASTTAAIIGGGAALDPATGKITNPSIKVGDTTYDTLAGAITQAALMGGDSADAVKYDTTAHDKVTFGGTAATKAVTLSNVAAGQADTDAVNVKQLTDAGLVVNSTGGAANAFVAYDNNTSKDTITLKGTAGTTKITKLTNGTLSAASSDAVNGSQLFNTASSAAAIIGGGAALDPNTGTISKPAVTVGGTTFDNLAGAITAAGTTATDAKAAVADAVKYDSSAHDRVTFGGTSSTTPVVLSNVAQGSKGTDAVNVDQLTALGMQVDSNGKALNAFVAYDSADKTTVTLNSGGTATKIQNVANGTSTTDAVNLGQLNDLASKNQQLNNSLKYVSFGPSIAAYANASGTDSMALGGNSFASADRSLALGLNARAGYADSVAIGTNSTVTAANTVSVGSAGRERKIMFVAQGTKGTDAVNLSQVQSLISGATTTLQQEQQTLLQSTAKLGASALTASAQNWTDVLATGDTDKAGQTQAVGTDAMAIGLNTHATDAHATAIGQNVLATAAGAVAIGNGSMSNGIEATAIGVNASVTVDHALAIGYSAMSDAEDGIAIGSSAYTAGAQSLAIGKEAVVTDTATGSFLLGNNSSVTGANSFVIGSDIANASGKNSVVLGSGSDGSQDNVVSVGAKGKERKIVNVAAGATTTDAVNYGQLTTALAGITGGSGSPDGVVYDSSAHDKLTLGGTSATAPAVLTNLAAGKMGSDAVNVAQVLPLATALGTTIDPTTGAVVAPSFSARGKTSATVQGALSSLDDAITGNTTDITNINTKIAGLGESLVTQASAGSDIMVASGKDGAHVNFAGQGVASRELINVSAGTKDTSAVNLSQLKPVVDALGGGAAISPAGVVTGPTYTIGGNDLHNAGDAFKAVDGNLTNLNNTVAGITAGGTGMVVQDPTSRDITVGAVNDGTRVNFAGTAGNRVLTGLGDGAINDQSSDAVNGKQIAGISSSFATAIGGGSMMNPDGTVTIPSFTVGGDTVHNVGDAITNLDGRVTSVTNNYSDLQNEITNIKNNGVATPNAVAYDSSAHDQLTLGNKDTGTTTKISGVTAGDLSEGSTDAVNGGQLFDTNTKLATLEDSVQNIATTGSTSIGINGTNGINGANGVDGAPAVASATGNDAIAMGDNASASGDHAVVIGGGASGTADGTIAIGGNANSSGKDSIAIGNGATAPANNAVALGAGSVADRDNTVSVGSPDQQRQITNVAAGTQGTDAVNLNQMNQAVGGIARKAYSGIAAATALTMIPDVDANKTLSIGIGGGTFQGYAATAIGGTARITQNIKVRVGAGWSAAGTTVGAGASYQW